MLPTTFNSGNVAFQHIPAATSRQQHALLRRRNTLLCSSCFVLLTLLSMLLQPHSAAGVFKNAATTAIAYNDTARECSSIDVRNDCQSLEQLNGCTVIKGYLIIVLLPKVSNNNTRETCNYTMYQFKRLKEITDYLLFFDVKGLTSIRFMFPSLTVIRGRRLFLNYALGISGMPDLVRVEFSALVAIQRGNVYIGSCPKLCHLDKINWNRLTLAPGENNIFPEEPAACLPSNDCKGCDSGYCWSNFVCQKFENTNTANYVQGPHECHAECLGGCYKNDTSNEGCVVCRSLTEHGACVEQCPENKYLLEHFQRCYTREECVIELDSFIYESTCVSECPFGYIADNHTSECIACTESDACIKYCSPHVPYDAVTINNLADADQIQGCQILNGSLVIAIRNAVNERDLLQSLVSLREIRGHLKISRSPHLTSLKFLQNLEKISGDPLENGLYAIIIYDNDNLKELWNAEHLELDKGSMYVHLNNKLCNRSLREFRNKVVHDQLKDSLQTSDQEVLCDPAKLVLEVQVLAHNALRFSWKKLQTSDEIEVLYRPILPGEKFGEDSELDSNVCTRINWQRRLAFPSELQDNGTHYSISIKGLTQNTQYACLLKTFGSNEHKNARSLLQLVRTKPDKPTPPAINISKRTETSLTLQLMPQNSSLEIIDYYRLDIFEHADDQHLLDQRNYCDQPALLQTANRNEDYDDCCARQEEEAEDQLFKQNMRETFPCTLDKRENCAAYSTTAWPDIQKPLQSFRLMSNETTYALHHLERFRLYTLQLQACNNAVGCGAYSLLSERTNYSSVGDKLEDLRACRIPATTEYHIQFSEPKHPNGPVVSYIIHYRVYNASANDFLTHLNCVTRLQHAEANFRHVGILNTTFNEVAVRVHSLAGDALSQWVNVTECVGVASEKTTRLAGIGIVAAGAHGHGQGVNVFLVCFLIGAAGTGLWICYKRRCWRKLPEMRRYLPLTYNWRDVVASEAIVEDRQILVDGFETVRFQNNADDDQKYLE